MIMAVSGTEVSKSGAVATATLDYKHSAVLGIQEYSYNANPRPSKATTVEIRNADQAF